MSTMLRTLFFALMALSFASLHACSCNDEGTTPTEDTGVPIVSIDAGSPDDDQGTEDEDPCADEGVCRDDQVCSSGADRVATCSCPSGSHEEDGSCVDDSRCLPTTCGGHGQCSDSDAGPTCACETGWAGAFCDACDDANGWTDDGLGGCTDDPCSLVDCGDKVCEIDAAGATSCACPAGTHPDGDICEPDRTCTPNSCNGRGTCDDAGGSVLCRCDEGFAGESCTECDDTTGYHDDGAGGCTTDPCLPNPCADPNKTQCSANGTSATCACDAGYHDDGAGNCVVDETCEPGSCGGNGVCDDSTGVIACACDAGYLGDDCAACDAAGGFHPDGMGGCSDDPCVPNPCTLVPNKTECVSLGMGTQCECAPGYHADGMGGCSDDPCLPNPCAASNQACRENMGNAECYTPDCNDNDPCTDDTLQQGVCVYSSVVCDDGNPCTDDSCAAGSGCVFAPDDTAIPDDGVACTDDACSGGFASHTPSDLNCDDGAYCNGVEVCSPGDGAADADGCVTRSVPAAPPAPGPCSFYGACDESSDSFPLQTANPGDSCNDGLYCTSNDVCNASGQCRGTPAGTCGTLSSCGATTPFPASIDIPQGTLSLTLTLGGQPLPASGNDGSSHLIYAVARDTGVRHLISSFSWDTYYDPDLRRTDAERLMPGVYDILYRKGETSTDSGYVYRTDAFDVGPNGVRLLATDVTVYAGHNDLVVDIPQTDINVNLTLAGQPLSDSGNDGSSHLIYAVAQDTGVRHLISSFSWDTYYDPDLRRTDAERLIPGTYDILYRKGETSTDSGYVYRTDSYDVGPNGVQWLARDVVVSGASTSIDLDIPQTTITLDVTLGGAPLPASGNDGSSHLLYAVNKDTGVRHLISSFSWDTYYDPDLRRTDAERLIPGTYDILYHKGETSTDSGYVYRTDSYDMGPNGVRILATDLVVAGASQTIAIDIPQADITLDLTLGGQPLPMSGNDGSSHLIYAVARDTGVRHLISSFSWDAYYDPDLRRTDAERLIPGTYDILYRKGETSTDSGYVYRTDSYDVGPNGVRILATDVVVTAGTNTLAIDIPQTPISLDITLGGQPLPSSGNDGSSHLIYAVSRDTGVRHLISSFSWDSYYDPDLRRTDAERLMPGTYDILYRKGETSTDSGYVYRTDAYDIGPNGVRVLAADVVVLGNMSQLITIDIPQTAIAFDITLADQPLPASGNDGSSHLLYAVSRDTGKRHLISSFSWDSYYDPDLRRTDAERLMPGTYDVLYRKGETSTDSGYVYRTDAYDIGPNGVRYVGICYEVQ